MCFALRMGSCVVLLAFGQLPLRAGPSTDPTAPGHAVSVGWDPSPDGSVIGYFIYWGVASGHCTNRLDFGNVTSATVTGLETNVTYYLTVVAYTGTGGESQPSNELQYSVPVDSPVPAAPKLGVELAGTGGTGAVLRVSFQGISGGTYDIQASQDLEHWETLWTTNCVSDGLTVFELSDLMNYPTRFFRLLRE